MTRLLIENATNVNTFQVTGNDCANSRDNLLSLLQGVSEVRFYLEASTPK